MAKRFLRHIKVCNNFDPALFTPFLVDRQVVGWIQPEVVERLLAEKHIHGDQAQLELSQELKNFDQRTDVLDEIVQRLKAEGMVEILLNEPYPVTPGGREEALCQVDRGASGVLGLRSFGQHLNGYVRTDEGISMWVGRRARDRIICPGQLDQLVAGGLPLNVPLQNNLVKECYEEAGIDEGLAMRSVPVGTISYNRVSVRGVKQDVIYCYDLELPTDFQPRCTDGEVEAFYLMPLQEVAERVRDTDEFKLNCNLVIIDFLIRHGWLQPDQEGYVELVSGLRSPLIRS